MGGGGVTVSNEDYMLQTSVMLSQLVMMHYRRTG